MGSVNETGWPKVTGPRFDKLRTMYIRFQVKGTCTEGCSLVHIAKSKMSNKQETNITAKFRAVYGSDGVNCRRSFQIVK